MVSVTSLLAFFESATVYLGFGLADAQSPRSSTPLIPRSLSWAQPQVARSPRVTVIPGLGETSGFVHDHTRFPCSVDCRAHMQTMTSRFLRPAESTVHQVSPHRRFHPSTDFTLGLLHCTWRVNCVVSKYKKKKNSTVYGRWLHPQADPGFCMSCKS